MKTDNCVPITLTRTGNTPLRFTGSLIAESCGSRDANGKSEDRWHNLAIYLTEGGKYIVRIDYETRWQGELSHNSAAIIADEEAVVSMLRSYDPCSRVSGYPPQEVYRSRQQRLMNDIRSRYETQVSEILSAAGFAEVVD